MPKGWFTQEPRFVPRSNPKSEDDGWVLTYVFDESQLDANGECPEDAIGELWIIDATNMQDVVAKIKLPQRVPYGLHGTWFPEDEIAGQRSFDAVRREIHKDGLDLAGFWSVVRDKLERWIG